MFLRVCCCVVSSVMFTCFQSLFCIDSDVLFLIIVFFFFFKQKTAYEMRISDWSSDVCSSDLAHEARRVAAGALRAGDRREVGAGFAQRRVRHRNEEAVEIGLLGGARAAAVVVAAAFQQQEAGRRAELAAVGDDRGVVVVGGLGCFVRLVADKGRLAVGGPPQPPGVAILRRDRKSAGKGKRVSVRVDLGGSRVIKKKK